MTDITRKLASVQKIIDVAPIEGADMICSYKVNGWWVVDKINTYNIGDMVVYIEIDSWIPTEIAPFLSKGKEPREYNGVKGERLKTIKLKKKLSQGLILSLDAIGCDYTEGDDVTEVLGIQKWEAYIPAQLVGLCKGLFPLFIPKTDQERIQNIQSEITDAYLTNSVYEMTLKMDGSSCTIYHNDGVVGVCSRNLELKVNDDNKDNSFVAIANTTNILNALKSYGKNIAVQGELMAPGIQGNKENFINPQLFVFDVYDIDECRYYSHSERMYIMTELYVRGYSGMEVPILHHNFLLPTDNIDDLLELAKGKSINAPIREGIVLKRHDGKHSFKIINNDFLLKNE